ncbi:hypothetical protein BDZ45DRAFT_449 [Acephala macrosclerotiorum]|nr:hypothetical protein BDZ45DRAFT_449 [Acephala macrosclerotiorum]
MRSAMQEVGLRRKEKPWEWKFMVPETVGIFDGEKMIVEVVDSSEFSSLWGLVGEVWREGYSAWLLRKWRFEWCELVKFTWRYGMSPLKLKWAVERELRKFHGVGEVLSIPPPRKRPFNCLDIELKQNGLDGVLLGPADIYLKSLGLSEKFINEVVEPTVRAKFGLEMEEVSGLEALLAIRDLVRRKVQVEGGNRRLVDRLIMLSDARVAFGKRVMRIERGERKRWRVVMEGVVRRDTGRSMMLLLLLLRSI